MIKGPITPILVSLSLVTLSIWERKNGWMKAFLNVPAILVFLLIWVPWAITMWVTTDGAFFVESLGKDFSGKLISTQERHSGPPGYYFGFIWLTLWPSCLLLLPAFAFAIRAVKNGKGSDAAVVKAMRLCLAWVLPYWALIRRINAVIYFGISAALIAVIMAAYTLYGGGDKILTYIVYGIGCAAGLAAVIASFGLWQAKMQLSLISAGLSSLILSVATYQFIMPNLTTLRVTDHILDYQKKDGEEIMEKIRRSATQAGLCTKIAPTFEGINYSKGDDVEIAIIRAVECPSETSSAQSQPSE